MKNSFIPLRRLLWLGLLLLSAATFFSCAKQPLTEAEEKEALKARVHAVWDAMIAVDFDKVYEFTTPAYRKAYSKAHFFSRYGNQVSRESITVVDITFQNPERTTAKVGFNLTFSTRGYSKAEIVRNAVYVSETWIKEDGEWWRVEPA